MNMLEELRAREPIFHRPEWGTTRADFERMTDEAFWEIGASGRIYTRAEILDLLEVRHSKAHEDVLKASNFAARELADGLFLLTYDLLQDGVRRTRRTTIWRRAGDGWKAVFHQGTIVQAT